MAKHSVSTNRVTGRFQSKKKQLAGLNGPKIHCAAWLPEIDLIYAGLCGKKIKPIVVCVSNP